MTATPKPYDVVYDGTATKQLQYALSPIGWLPIDIVLSSYTTTARTALLGVMPGTLVLDTTLNKLYFYGTDSAWHSVTSV
jgi:hypothetical protein